MKTAAVFWFIVLIPNLITSAPAICNTSVLCPCGSSNSKFRLCVDAFKDTINPCEIWSKCETCEDNLSHCVTCPQNRSGLLCSEENLKRIKRQHPLDYKNLTQTVDPRFFGPCPQLSSPDVGLMTCSRNETVRSCTGRCFPGYAFVGAEDKDEITLECQNNTWSSETFPSCKSEGYCKITLEGPGSFTCNTSMDGTRCDVTCDGNNQGQYHCYPGKDWEPDLPYCALSGASPIKCPDPGEVSNADRVNTNGNPSRSGRIFTAGQSVLYRCREGYTLNGTSILTCLRNKKWSSTKPRCLKNGEISIMLTDEKPPTEDKTTCNQPKVDVNGFIEDHPLLDPIKRSNRFPPGTQLVLSCREGYQSVGPNVLNCLKTGNWSSSPPTCAETFPLEDYPCDYDDITCGQPEADVNGFIEAHPQLDASKRNNRFSPGTQLVFSCREGYRSVKANILTCLGTGQWSSSPPTCEEIFPAKDSRPEKKTCSHPGVDQNGEVEDNSFNRVKDQQFSPGTKLTYKCDEGYELKGVNTIECLRNGEWSSTAPKCVPEIRSSVVYVESITCPHPGVDENGDIKETAFLDIKARNQTFPPGTELTFTCNKGYVLNGSALLECLSSGEWTNTVPACIPQLPSSGKPTKEDQVTCPHPGVDENGKIKETPLLDPNKRDQRFPPGTELTYTCNEGYQPNGPVVIECLHMGVWSDTAPTCMSKTNSKVTPLDGSQVTCPHPGVDENGEIKETPLLDPKVRNQRFPPGTELTYTCHKGYQLYGVNVIECLPDGEWSDYVPQCSEVLTFSVTSSQDGQVTCPHPGVDENGEIKETPLLDPKMRSQRFPPGTELTYTCRKGYELYGAIALECLHNGEWSDYAPECRPELNISVTLLKDSQVICPHPGVDENGEIKETPLLDPKVRNQRFPPGTELTYACHKGYKLYGTATIECLHSGEWSDYIPECKPELNYSVTREEDDQLNCPHPGVDENGEIKETPLLDPKMRNQKFPPGTELTYTCHDGYKLYGSTVIECLYNGVWSDYSPECVPERTSLDAVYPSEESPKTCKHPGVDENGKIKETPLLDANKRDQLFPPGTELSYACNEGYLLYGSTNIECLYNGEWSNYVPECLPEDRSLVVTSEKSPMTCQHPGVDENGDIKETPLLDPNKRDQRFPTGTELTYTCRKGYRLYGVNVIECLHNGEWSDYVPECVPEIRSPVTPSEESNVTCPHPGVDKNGEIKETPLLDPKVKDQRFPPGTELTYTCKKGYKLYGEATIECLHNGEWSNFAPECETEIPSKETLSKEIYINCRHPGLYENGEIEEIPLLGKRIRDQRFPPGTKLTYACNKGYRLENPVTIECLKNGEWTEAAPVCILVGSPEDAAPMPVICSKPSVDPNGKIETLLLADQVFPAGMKISYSCNTGYKLEGAAMIECQKNGEWTAAAPVCKQSIISPEVLPRNQTVTCDNPGVDPNGEITRVLFAQGVIDRRFPSGSKLFYACNRGYKLEGAASIECLQNGTWTKDAPTCKKENIRPTDGSAKQCATMEPIPNGKILVFKYMDGRPSTNDKDLTYPPGTRLHYYCNMGYLLLGSNKRTCMPSGQWNAKAPTCSEDCGLSLISLNTKIIRGENTLPGDWPWTVAIATTTINNFTSIICGGALLDRNTVITAAHCLTSQPVYTLYFGKYHALDAKDDNMVVKRLTTKITLHKDFNETTYDNDIALLRFEPSISYNERIIKICLPTLRSTTRNLVPGKLGYVTGWGVTQWKRQSDELLMARLPVQPRGKCEWVFGASMLPPGTFCTGFDDGMTTVCTGDSGSPFMFYDRLTSRYNLEGLVSFAPTGQCDMPYKYTVFTRVSDFMPWILKNWSDGRRKFPKTQKRNNTEALFDANKWKFIWSKV